MLANRTRQGYNSYCSFGGGRIDRPWKRQVVLSPPPFEGVKRNSLRKKSVWVSGEFSRNYEKNSDQHHRPSETYKIDSDLKPGPPTDKSLRVPPAVKRYLLLDKNTALPLPDLPAMLGGCCRMKEVINA
jgi:hypothetical protein